MTDLPSESATRRRALRAGYNVRKSRQRSHVPNADNHGEYMLIEARRNAVVLGERFNASLADIQSYLDRATGEIVRRW